MRIAIRVDAGLHIGIGHVMRCLSLADNLRTRGHETFFLTRKHQGNIIDVIVGRGHHVLELDKTESFAQKSGNLEYVDWLGVKWDIDAEQTMELLSEEGVFDWLIVDHYGIDARWEKQVSTCVDKVMVIDDLANRLHECNIIIDQNLYKDMECRYDDYLPARCKKLMGPEYAMLSSEFSAHRKSSSGRNGIVRNILVFFGGADKTNETAKVLDALQILALSDVTYNVVVGMSNPSKDDIKSICEKLDNANYYCQIDNMMEMMSRADLALGAGGTSTWERCALGLPAIIVAVAFHQERIAESVHQAGAVKYLGNSADIGVERWVTEISSLLDNIDEIKKMSEQGKALVDGRGVERVVDAMEAMS